MIVEQLKNTPEELVFSNVIAYIDEHYEFTPTKFTNGNTVNEANQNNGSCKFSVLPKSTNFLQKRRFYYLASFTEDVLKNPEGTDHQNIRNFMKFGWEGIVFEGEALKKK
jgi:hypothetical protein